ncbi:hypothetical protein RJ639_024143 [Escallonia herrerae]|uniref:Uncharacterized protein n=1 Tax=Escallonia herrerae TaxID=1293975 RepID=A0AA89ADW2_9ASTE|nr:hypothetical protein RJ639_024143 [Escallonia herrerae]
MATNTKQSFAISLSRASSNSSSKGNLPDYPWIYPNRPGKDPLDPRNQITAIEHNRTTPRNTAISRQLVHRSASIRYINPVLVILQTINWSSHSIYCTSSCSAVDNQKIRAQVLQD